MALTHGSSQAHSGPVRPERIILPAGLSLIPVILSISNYLICLQERSREIKPTVEVFKWPIKPPGRDEVRASVAAFGSGHYHHHHHIFLSSLQDVINLN